MTWHHCQRCKKEVAEVTVHRVVGAEGKRGQRRVCLNCAETLCETGDWTDETE